MHLSEGILSGPVLAGGAIFAALGVAKGLRAMEDDDIPRTAILTTAFFVASLIHVPIGPASIHLILSGLCGLLLGWRTFPALLVALFLQAILFGFGGLTVLGVNTFILATPAVALGLIGRTWLQASAIDPRRAAICGALVGSISILFSGLLAAGALALSARSFIGAAGFLLAAHAPLMVVEGILTAGIATFLARVRPELFTGNR
ncbi:MAG TPA: cobalt transporter CbiM [Kiritimatiellia bacterium]|nr:cobalt transporter CbiM [Kiritimatiellia bacterium]